MDCSSCGGKNFDWAPRCDHCGRALKPDRVASMPSGHLPVRSMPTAVSERVSPHRPVATVPTALRLDSVRFDELGAAEMDGRQAVVFVPRAEIVGIELAHTTAVSNPWTVGIVGIVVLAVSIGLPVFSLIASRGEFRNRAEMVWGIRVWYLAVFALPAFWMIKLAVQKRWVVVVHTSRSPRHLTFLNAPERDDVGLR